MENLKTTEIDRINEIAFYEVYNHLIRVIPRERLFIFLENYCRVFSIDYTSIMMACTSFVRKLEPSKYERTMFAVVTGIKLNTLGLDYRTIRSHRKKFEDGKMELYPRIPNGFILKDIGRFVKSYYKLFAKDAEYLHNYFVGEGEDE